MVIRWQLCGDGNMDVTAVGRVRLFRRSQSTWHLRGNYSPLCISWIPLCALYVPVLSPHHMVTLIIAGLMKTITMRQSAHYPCSYIQWSHHAIVGYLLRNRISALGSGTRLAAKHTFAGLGVSLASLRS